MDVVYRIVCIWLYPITLVVPYESSICGFYGRIRIYCHTYLVRLHVSRRGRLRCGYIIEVCGFFIVTFILYYGSGVYYYW